MIVQARQIDFSYQGRNWKGFHLESAGGNSFSGRKLIWAAGARRLQKDIGPVIVILWLLREPENQINNQRCSMR